MTDEYRPTTDDVRQHALEYNGLGMFEDDFDAWLAEYTRQQREEAFDEGWLERSLVVDVPVWENPYRQEES